MEAVGPSKASSCTAKPKKRIPASWALLRAGRCRRPPRTRAALARSRTKNWAGLADDMVGLIAEHVLAYDVVDYICFRAVCRQWRQCSADPRLQDWLDRRFHPHRWILIKEKHATPGHLWFLNTYPVRGIRVDIPELHDHYLLGDTCERLLVLLRRDDGDQVRLLDPFTRQLTWLPPLTTLLPSHYHDRLGSESHLDAWGSGNAEDNSAFVLCLNKLGIVGVVKPGDVRWTLLHSHIGNYGGPPIKVSKMFVGPF